MSASELEAKPGAIISSDQLRDDAITGKLTELLAGNRPEVAPVQASFIVGFFGQEVEVNAPNIGKFNGQWNPAVIAGQSEGELYRRRHLRGRYTIVVTLSQSWTHIVFKKAPDEPEGPKKPEGDVDERLHPPLPDAVFKGKGMPNVSLTTVNAGFGHWSAE